jgi:glucosamine kinase
MRFAGGWGMLLGDEASAQWVGRRTLALVLETMDGRRPRSALAAELLADFRDPPGILAFASGADPAAFGALAPRVSEHALRGDPLAQAVMRQGAEEIARSLRDLGWTAGQPICLTGGIGPAFANDLPGDMQADLAAPRGSPLDGALALARDFARTRIDASG